MLDDARLIAQIVQPRAPNRARWPRQHRSRPNAHDDVANAVAGVVSMLATDANEYDESYDWVFGPGKDPDDPDPEWQQQRYANFIATGGYKRPW